VKNKKSQEKLKRWYEKGFWGVYKLNCPVCGTDYYTVNNNQPICNQEKCKIKWATICQEAEESS